MSLPLKNILDQATLLDQKSIFTGLSTHPNSLGLNIIADRLNPQLDAHGITRVSSITGYSDLLLPVWIAVRPNSKALSQSSGKSLTHTSACIGACMESLELACAEEFRSSDRNLYSYLDLQSSNCQVVDLDQYPLVTPLFAPSKPIHWTSAKHISHLLQPDSVCPDVLIPEKFCNLSFNSSDILPGFNNTSNGLASGFSMLEATTQALLELIERHCTTSCQMGGLFKRVDVDTIPPSCRNLITQIEKLGYTTRVLDATLFPSLPTYQFDFVPNSPDTQFTGGLGWGTHPNPEIALTRAIIEANQARTIIISGGRDDMPKSLYINEQLRNTPASSLTVSTAELPLSTISFEDASSFPLADYLPAIKDDLLSHGYPDIYFVELSPPDSPVHVSKVFVPGMEGYLSHSYHPVNRSNYKGYMYGPHQFKSNLHEIKARLRQHRLIRLNAGGVGQ